MLHDPISCTAEQSGSENTALSDIRSGEETGGERHSCTPLLNDSYSATSNNTKLVHWPLMGWLLHLVQQGGDWAGSQPTQASPRCTINDQCTNHHTAV